MRPRGVLGEVVSLLFPHKASGLVSLFPHGPAARVSSRGLLCQESCPLSLAFWVPGLSCYSSDLRHGSSVVDKVFFKPSHILFHGHA